MTNQSILHHLANKYLKQSTAKTHEIDTVDTNYYEKQNLKLNLAN